MLTIMDNGKGLELVASFTATLLDNPEPQDVGEALAHAVQVATDTYGAGVAVTDEDQRLQPLAVTGDDIRDVELSQLQPQDGPCVDAYRRSAPVTVDDLHRTARWSELSRAAAAHGVRAVAAVPLGNEQSEVGVVTVYARGPRRWRRTRIKRAQVLADTAALYLRGRRQLVDATTLAGQLQHALDARIVIEQAKGMLAERWRIGVDEAFELLRRRARSKQIKVRDVAADVVTRRIRS